MTALARKGWCPSLASPMRVADGLLVRVKPTAATIPAAGARALADAARRCGNGLLDLTMRSNLQVRGLADDTVTAFAEAMIANGLGHADSRVEAVRNVMTDPLGRDDPRATFDSHAVARAVEEALAARPSLWRLPQKFGFLVDGGQALVLDGCRADVCVRARSDELLVHLDGGRLAVACTAETAADTACRLALAFLELAGELAHRVRSLLETVAEERVFAATGLAPDRIPFAPHARPAPAGFVRFPGRHEGAMLVRATDGRLTAAMLAELARLAEDFADATIRTTPWRAVALSGVPAAQAPNLAVRLAALGLIVEAPQLIATGDAA